MFITPLFTSKPCRFPDLKVGLPVVKVALEVFMYFKPFIFKPFWFAMITSALFPATSRVPFRLLGVLPITSFSISLALFEYFRFWFALTNPASWVSVRCFELFRIKPF